MIDSKTSAQPARDPQLPWRILHEHDAARMVAQHATVRGLCAALEDCADQLPRRDAIVEGIRVTAALAEVLRRHEVVEDAILDSLVDVDPTISMGAVLTRIRHRYAVDHLHAEDLRDALAAAASTPGTLQGDKLGYMMRCLFDGCRRAVDFREAAILILAHDRLTPAARATLIASLIGLVQGA